LTIIEIFFNFELKLMKMKLSVINIDPELMGGTPVFRGTRVPIQALFDHLPEPGISEFLYGFPSITMDMVEEVLAIAAKKVTSKQRKKIHHESVS
jgi:uncharacterized protein (DUF433 family)